MPKTQNSEQQQLPGMYVRAEVSAGSVNEEQRTVDVVFATETPVARYSWRDDMMYNEILSLDPAHVRTDRLRAGAPVLDNHNRWDGVGSQLGRTDAFTIENRQGKATLRFSKRAEVTPIWEDVRDRIITGISVGYRVHRLERISDTPEGMRQYRATDWEPLEISLAPVPADINSGVRSDKAPMYPVEIIDNISTIQNRAAMPDTTQTPAPAPAPTPAPAPAPAPAGEGNRSQEPTLTEEQRAAIVAQERARTKDIKDAVRAAGLEDAFADELVERGVSVDTAREKIIAKLAERSAANGANGANSARVTRDDNRTLENAAIAEAIAHRYDSTTKLSDGARQYRYMSLLDVARHLVETRLGERTVGMSAMDVLERAHSTSDFPLLLSNVMNKFLRAGYEATPTVWKRFARQRNANDFKEMSGLQIGANIQLEEVKEGSEYKYDTMKESGEKLKLKTYGKILKITRQAIINDDLDALTRVPEFFGRSAADLERRIVFGLLLANSGAGVTMSDNKTLFHADHKNNATTLATITDDSLSAARVSMMRQKGIAGEKINITPRFLMVPPELLTTAQKILNPLVVPDQAANVNIFRGQLEILADAELEDVKRWYVLADPAQVDMIGYSYLNGAEGLYTETKYGFETDGVAVKARLDFGATVWDYRGFYRNNGPA